MTAARAGEDTSWHGTALAAALNLIGMSGDLAISRSVGGVPWWPNAAAMGLSVVVLTLLVGGHHGRRVTAAAFLALNLGIVGALWVTDAHYATVPTWVPFRPHQLGIFAVALLAPPILWVGIVSIALFAGSAALQFLTFPPEVRLRSPGELWVLLIYGVFGVAVLVYRLQRLDSERARLRAESDAAAMRRVARSFMALRDLANTPLQTLVVAVALLREEHPELEPTLERMERALSRLRESTELLSRYDQHLRWDPSDTSFDPVEILQQQSDREPPPR